jgi:hypothetical protein
MSAWSNLTDNHPFPQNSAHITTKVVSSMCTQYQIMWYSIPVFSTDKTDRHDISTEILLKVALNIITLTITQLNIHKKNVDNFW